MSKPHVLEVRLDAAGKVGGGMVKLDGVVLHTTSLKIKARLRNPTKVSFTLTNVEVRVLEETE